MSLTIYSDFDEVKDKDNFVYDVCPLFFVLGIPDTDFSRKVLKEIEKGSYYSRSRFMSRFGVCLDLDDMSVSSKALILTSMATNKIINFMEVGCECMDYVTDLHEGSIYVPKRCIEDYDWGPYSKEIDVIYKGINYSSNYSFIKYLEEDGIL